MFVGYRTYLGAGIKLLTAVLAVLVALNVEDYNEAVKALTALIALFSGGEALTSFGLRKAIENLK